MNDFNDMASDCGPEAVRQRIEDAAPIPSADAGQETQWPEPQPLVKQHESETYPLDALPDTIRDAVAEVAAFVQAPIPLVACSALSAVSLAIQAYVDVQRAEKLNGPVGLFLLVIADSGERKSTCDSFFTQVIRDYEAEQAKVAEPELKQYQAKLDAWTAKGSGMKDTIRRLAKDGKSSADWDKKLEEHALRQPTPPRVPRLLYGDSTPEALAYDLTKKWPSGGIVSSEAGAVFGAHGMGKDSVMRNLSLLNTLWDGGTFQIGRRTTESFTVRGARLTVALQVQSATLHEFMARSGPLARGIGFFARCLLAHPESTQGYRPFVEAPAHWPALATFNQRIELILKSPPPIEEDGTLAPIMLPLSLDAKELWVRYHDAIEGELKFRGELYDVRDVASKTADNAVRLAALFEVFEHQSDEVVKDCFENAGRIVMWHLLESRRFFGDLALPPDRVDAARLDRWLIDHCRREQISNVPKNHVLQHGPLRESDRLNKAINELVTMDRLRLVKGEKKFLLELNPALLLTTP